MKQEVETSKLEEHNTHWQLKGALEQIKKLNKEYEEQELNWKSKADNSTERIFRLLDKIDQLERRTPKVDSSECVNQHLKKATEIKPKITDTETKTSKTYKLEQTTEKYGNPEDARDINQWIFTIEQQFKRDQVPEEIKVAMVSTFLRGKAAVSYRHFVMSEEAKHRTPSWEDLKKVLKTEFESPHRKHEFEYKLRALKHEDSFMGYVRRFKELSSECDQDDKTLVKWFVKALKPNYRFQYRERMTGETETRDLDTIVRSLMAYDENVLAEKKELANRKTYQTRICNFTKSKVNNSAQFVKRFNNNRNFRSPRDRERKTSRSFSREGSFRDKSFSPRTFRGRSTSNGRFLKGRKFSNERIKKVTF